MSGLYPHAHRAIHNQWPLPTHVRTLGDCLPDDYRTAYIGKWHLGDEHVAQHGFEHWVSICDSPWYCSKPEYERLHSDYHRYLVERGYEPEGTNSRTGLPRFGKVRQARMPEGDTPAEFVADEAVRFLRDAGDEPFAACVSFIEPHNPFTSRFDDRYDPGALPVGSQFLVPPTGMSSRTQAIADRCDPASIDRTFLNQAGDDLSDEAGWRRVRARYFGLVTLVDRALARVLDTLHDTGLDRNTIVVFTSDHGEMMGDHRLITKGVLYEEAVRVPLLMHVPQLGPPPRTIPGRVSQIDLLPTLLDLLGISAHQPMHGRSLRRILEGDATLEANDIFIEWETPDDTPTYHLPGRWRTIISNNWKLSVTADDRPELFDLASDPGESVNRIDDPTARDRARDLMHRLHQWQTRTGDRAALACSS